MNIELFLSNAPRSALLLCEKADIGLAAAEKICSRITGIECDFSALGHPDITLINSEKPGVEEAEIIVSQSMMLPVAAKKRVIVISNAHNFSVEGQNKLLKMLEESNSCIVLFISSGLLIRTIMSRIAVIKLDEKEKNDDVHTAIINESCLFIKNGSIKEALATLRLIKEKEESVLENKDTYLHFFRELKNTLFDIMCNVYSHKEDVAELYKQKDSNYFLEVITACSEMQKTGFDCNRVMSFFVKFFTERKDINVI